MPVRCQNCGDPRIKVMPAAPCPHCETLPVNVLLAEVLGELGTLPFEDVRQILHAARAAFQGTVSDSPQSPPSGTSMAAALATPERATATRALLAEVGRLILHNKKTLAGGVAALLMKACLQQLGHDPKRAIARIGTDNVSAM